MGPSVEFKVGSDGAMGRPVKFGLSVGKILLAFAATVLLGCATPTLSRCPAIAPDRARPSIPTPFAEVDELLVERARSMAASASELKRSLMVLYRREFLEELLPRLCSLVEDARRRAAAAGAASTPESSAAEARAAGVRYQGLLVISQVMELELAMARMEDFADQQGQYSRGIADQLAAFDRDMAPLMAAALSNDGARLSAAMPEGISRYNAWVAHLDTWAASLKKGQQWWSRARLALDLTMLAIAARDLARMAAEGASMGPPPFAGVTSGGAAVASNLSAEAVAQAVEAIRKLIASGAMDPVIVAGVSMMGPRQADTFSSVQRPVAMGSTRPSAPSPSTKPSPVRRIEISKRRFGEAAEHVEDAQAAGKPRLLTIDRVGKQARRLEALRDHPLKPALDRDEYPQAMFLEGGAQADVRYIDPSDNGALGAYIGNMCRDLPDGSVVELVIVP